MFVSAILLAAGESTRMGSPKALLPWEGTTLLEYQLAQLAAVDDIGEVIVVTGHQPERITEIGAAAGVRPVHNADYRSGKVSSIIAGLRAISPDADAIMLLAVDQPRPARILRAVVEASIARPRAITFPANQGRSGHPILFSSAMLPELLAISEETQGIRAVIRRHESEVHTVELSDPAVNIDLNTPADLDAARP